MARAVQCVANDRRAELAAEEGVNSSGRNKKKMI